MQSSLLAASSGRQCSGSGVVADSCQLAGWRRISRAGRGLAIIETQLRKCRFAQGHAGGRALIRLAGRGSGRMQLWSGSAIDWHGISRPWSVCQQIFFGESLSLSIWSADLRAQD